MSNITSQTIELYAKQLRLPTFNHYIDVIRQIGNNKSYEDFLISLMKMELDCSRFEYFTEAFVHELASCDFVSKRQNIVMIGNPGT